jgi:hypothetical protein
MTTTGNTDPAVPMDHAEKARLRTAAFRVTRLYPGPIGELVSRELLTWEEFGYRLGGHAMIMRLVQHVLTTPLVPEREQAGSAQHRAYLDRTPAAG